MSSGPDTDERTEANESQIAVHWQEEDYFLPPKSFVEQANMRDPKIREFAIDFAGPKLKATAERCAAQRLLMICSPLSRLSAWLSW